ERFVSEIVGERTIAAVEVPDQSPPHFEVTLSVRIGAVVEPLEQSCECGLGQYPFFSRDFRCENVHVALPGAINLRRFESQSVVPLDAPARLSSPATKDCSGVAIGCLQFSCATNHDLGTSVDA